MPRSFEDQLVGGVLTIPDGYFVSHVDLDAEIPFCTIIKDNCFPEDKKDVAIPKSLAYYLSTHHNGSDKFRKQLRRDAKNELRGQLKDLLEMEFEK